MDVLRHVTSNFPGRRSYIFQQPTDLLPSDRPGDVTNSFAAATEAVATGAPRRGMHQVQSSNGDNESHSERHVKSLGQ